MSIHTDSDKYLDTVLNSAYRVLKSRPMQRIETYQAIKKDAKCRLGLDHFEKFMFQLSEIGLVDYKNNRFSIPREYN